MAFIISPKVRDKLKIKHGVTEDQIIDCFCNRAGNFLEDTREEHKTNPPTLWFVADTDMGVKLKVIFVKDGKDIFIKTAYQPNEEEIAIYENKGLVK